RRAVLPDRPGTRAEKAMETRISEIADGIFRLSTFVPEIAPPSGFTFNQFLVLGEEPLLFHTGLRRMFPLTRAAVGRLISPERLCWIAFGHYEADECGAMNEWLAVAPRAQVPHGWDAGVIYEETTHTLMCGDLFTQVGDGPALTQGDVVGPAIAGEDLFNYSSLNP